jgi:hypothetical protein
MPVQAKAAAIQCRNSLKTELILRVRALHRRSPLVAWPRAARLRAAGETQADVARTYAVAPTTIGRLQAAP